LLIKGYHIFLDKLPFYCYAVILFIPDNFLCFEVCFIWN
jgi:hypothetical protein